MDSSSTTTPDKHGSETSQSLASSVHKPEATNVSGAPVACQREKRRREHNDSEKKRKEQIKACICRMGDLLPASYTTAERHSTLEIVEKSLNYMREMKEAGSKFSVTEESLREEIAILKTERDKLLDIIKAAGLSTESIPTNGVSSTTDVKAESPKPMKQKSKKRSVASGQLQQQKERQQQDMISSSMTGADDASMAANQLNMPSGAAFMNGQNMMFNPMMLQPGNQLMMPGMMGAGGQMVPGMMGPMTGMPGIGSLTPQPNSGGSMATHTPNSLGSQGDNNAAGNMMNKSADDTDASGLLQLAMQDAGITPGSSQSGTSSALTPSITETAQDSEPSHISQNNPLQTLASVAASTQDMETGTQSETQTGSNNVIQNSNVSVMASTVAGQSGMAAMQQAGMSMPPALVGNQAGMPPGSGQQQQMQQIMFINEQGIPMIANVPMNMDPNNPAMFQQNAQKQNMVAGQNQLKDQSGNSVDQNSLLLAQQQANLLQNPLLNAGNSGGNFPNMGFPQQGMIQGNIIQTPSGQLIQQIGPGVQGQGQLIGMNGQGQGIVVAGQQGPLALNTVPSQPNQYPSALILPNGQIIPVVTNAGGPMGSQAGMTLAPGQMPRMSGPQIQGLDGQGGLLIPAASGPGTTSSTAASLSTSVMPTSAIQSVMTTHIQGSTVQSQKLMSTPGSQPNVSGSTQQKLISTSMVGMPPGAKSGGPILISLPINGQSTTVLLDPQTMQVLGTVAPGQQASQAVVSAPSVVAPTVSSQGALTPNMTATAPVVAGPVAGKGKGKNNNPNQRAICPKPLGSDSARSQNTPSKKKKPAGKSAPKSKETAPADSLSDTLQIQIPESTTDPETASAVSSESTDILAKAAESIFSPSGEVATGTGFYNPANEDNPLHIDTSVTEADDDNKSPMKQTMKTSASKPASLDNAVLGLNSVAEGVETVPVKNSKVLSHNENVTSLSATLEEIAGLPFSDSASKSVTPMDISEPEKVTKKSKTSKTDDGKKSGYKPVSKSKSKKPAANENAGNMDTGVEHEKMDSNSQLDIESTLIHIPDEINFNATDLSDVLDQVEQLGAKPVDSPSSKGTSSKKAKTKRTKAADAESEPSLKKRKSGKDVTTKDAKSAPANTSRDLLSMPMSVYDFDDTDDMVPPLLPLSGKDFLVTPVKGSENSDSQEKNVKTDNKTPAQNVPKTKTPATNQKNPSKTNSKGASKDSSSKDSVEQSMTSVPLGKVNKDSIDKQSKESVKVNTDSKKEPPVSDVAASMPDIDTTTSLFGFPVPKKQQKAESASRQNTSKPSPSTNIKGSVPQTGAATSVPVKPPAVSPKSQPNNMVSPNQKSPFSPEMVSPKLSIVSPGQTLLSENESVSPQAKPYKDNSPIKKRTPPDSAKLSTLSALNPEPMSEHKPSFNNSVSNSRNVPKFDDVNKQTCSSGISQTTGVITTAKSMQSASVSNNDVNMSHPISAKSNEPSVTNKPLSDKSSSMNSMSNSNNSIAPNNMSVQKPPMNSNRNANSNMDKFNSQPPPPLNQRPSSSVGSSQSNRYPGPYGNDPGYNSMSNMNVNRSMANDPSMGPPGIAPYSAPFSDSIFNPMAEKVIKSPPNVNISTLGQQKPDTSGMSKIRPNPYSVDNFVESSRDDGLRSRPDSLATNMIPGADMANPGTDFSRLQSESSPDGFNFANIGLNLQPITSSADNYLETPSSVTGTSSFSFSLSSSASTVSTSAGGLGHHQFPFFPPMLSSAPPTAPSSQSALPSSMSSMDASGMYSHDRSDMSRMHASSNMNRPENPSMRAETMPRPDKGPSAAMPENINTSTNKPSCSKQKLPKASGPATIHNPFPPYNNSSAQENNFYHDSQMKSNVGKSPTESMRKVPDKPMDIGGSQSRSSSQSSIQDKRAANMDRSPQMMNNPNSFYPPANYPPSKSLNTPSLHHPGSMMPPDDRSRNMTNRSPYDAFPPPPASQGFNNMGPGFSNRFDPGHPSFSRDNSGTQPLTHTPVNTGGRKSANPPPPQTSVVKPPQKQPAPPLVPMGGQAPAPSQQTRPPNHRSSTPHGSSAQSTNPAANQSRTSKQPSRSSKPPSSSKKKNLPFVEVDSNLSNSIFEPNRSMTPFSPMQNLSPQFRGMPHDSGSFLPGNLFSGPRFPNSSTPMPKTTDIGPPFNTLFPPRGGQNGLGQSFLPGFGMNMNPLHGNHGNSAQLTPHTAPHMANFSLNNIFSDGPPQNDSSLNISPIKFPHANYQGMEHNPMQHHHQYNRGHPSVMSINSILGPNHHGFDGRMTTSMAGPFHSHGHPPFIPPLNFPMHDH